MGEQFIFEALANLGAVGLLIWFGWKIYRDTAARAEKAEVEVMTIQQEHLADLREMLQEQQRVARALAAATEAFRQDGHTTQESIRGLAQAIERLDTNTLALTQRLDAFLQR